METHNPQVHLQSSLGIPRDFSDLFEEALQRLHDSEVNRRELEATLEAKVALRTTFLNAVLNEVEEGICACDVKGRIVLSNRAAQRIFGGSDAGLEGASREASSFENWQEHLRVFEPVTGEVIGTPQLPLFTALEHGSVREVSIVTEKNGERRFLLCNAHPLFSPTGERLGAVCILRDRTQEREAQKKTETIERQNVELRNFATVAAHDLKSPLSSITQFVELLGEEYHGKLDDDARQIIGIISASGRRMSRMVDSLLLYARSGAEVTRSRGVDSQMICKAAVSNLTSVISRERAQVECGPLPLVDVDPDRLMQVFQNLIQNALKFRKPNSRAKVTIRGEDRGHDWLFRVRDNGIGIPETDREKVFDLFERLRAATPVEGSGVGMAVCKRIVEAHRGKIWIESGLVDGVENGTQVCFTIPRGV